MAIWLSAGTISVNTNSKSVVGVGTQFKTGPVPVGEGHTLFVVVGSGVDAYEIESVTDDTHLTIGQPFRSGSVTAGKYSIDPTKQGTFADLANRAAQALARMQNTLTKDDNLASLSDKAAARQALELKTAADNYKYPAKGVLLKTAAFGLGAGTAQNESITGSTAGNIGNHIDKGVHFYQMAAGLTDNPFGNEDATIIIMPDVTDFSTAITTIIAVSTVTGKVATGLRKKGQTAIIWNLGGGGGGSAAESKTFRPTLSGSGTPGTVTYSVQNGQAIKQGNIVTFTVEIDCTVSGITGALIIEGLPWAPSSGTPCYIPFFAQGIKLNGKIPQAQTGIKSGSPATGQLWLNAMDLTDGAGMTMVQATNIVTSNRVKLYVSGSYPTGWTA